MARPRLLFLASVAATLVSFVAAGGGESMGEGDCGEKETWKLKPGEVSGPLHQPVVTKSFDPLAGPRR